MSYLTSSYLLLSLAWHGLIFSSPNTWSFIGQVTETRQIHLMGLDTRLAHVKGPEIDVWVIQMMESQSKELSEIELGNAGVGDLVRVSISGNHVSKNGVDWNLCLPAGSNYCRQGGMYDNGPLSAEWNLPVSPSNEFIHFASTKPTIEQALFWNMELIEDDSIAAKLFTTRSKSRFPSAQCRGCRRLCRSGFQTIAAVITHGSTCFSGMDQNTVKWTGKKCIRRRNQRLAFHASTLRSSHRILTDAE